MHIHDVARAYELTQRLECANDALKRMGDAEAGRILERHRAGEIQVSASIPVELDDSDSHEPQYAVAMFPLPEFMVMDLIHESRARLKADIKAMTEELRDIGVVRVGLN